VPEFLHLSQAKPPGHLLLNYCWMHHMHLSRPVMGMEWTLSHLFWHLFQSTFHSSLQ
jgi:hypothetical protein